MLEKLILQNYTTFINKTEVDFSATNSKILDNDNVGKNKVLKGALFVGENASGKTNLLKALKLLISLLTSDHPIDFAKYKSFYTTENSYILTYVFLIQQRHVSYSITMNDTGIIAEKIKIDDKQVLNRNAHKATYSLDNNEVIRKDVSKELPFFRQMYYDTRFYKNSILNQLYDYILNSTYINCRDQRISVANRNTLDKITPKNYFANGGVQEVNKFFQTINYQQEIIYDDHTPISQQKHLNFKMPQPFISFKKQGTNIYIPEFFESTGNITLINILPSILWAIQNSSIVIVDEFSSGLHNALEESLIKYFFHFAKSSQIFFTTHSTNILNHTIIRPDQTYSVRFDYKNGGSVISRFSDQNPREAQNPEKMYLNGVFDEVPHYTKYFTN